MVRDRFQFRYRKILLILLASGIIASAQPKSKPVSVKAESRSSVRFSVEDGAQVLELVNSSYDVTAAFLPGRPQEERLVVRTTTQLKQVMDEMGSQASTTLDAWPLGEPLTRKPLYSFTVSGDAARIVDGTLIEVSRGLEDFAWWSVYQIGTGRHLFDTHVPMSGFSISRSVLTRRYAGLDVPPDDTKDARLGDPHVVAVLNYSSAEKVIRRALITCADANRARLLRSYFDVVRTVAMVETPTQGEEPLRTLEIKFRETFPSKGAAVSLRVPIAGDDLDLRHASVPQELRIAAWTQ